MSSESLEVCHGHTGIMGSGADSGPGDRRSASELEGHGPPSQALQAAGPGAAAAALQARQGPPFKFKLNLNLKLPVPLQVIACPIQ